MKNSMGKGKGLEIRAAYMKGGELLKNPEGEGWEIKYYQMMSGLERQTEEFVTNAQNNIKPL